VPNAYQADTPSRKELELFLKEVQTLAKLHHRNIVQFYGACLEMGSMFFVTELMKVRVCVLTRKYNQGMPRVQQPSVGAGWCVCV
jgi:serine/threonine protein kinase